MFKVLYSIAFSSPSEITSFIGDIASTIAGASLSSLSPATDKGMSWEDNTKWPTSTWSISSNTATPVGSIVLSAPFSAPFTGNKTLTLSVTEKVANTEYSMDAFITGGGISSRTARELRKDGNNYYDVVSANHFTIGKRSKVTISVSDKHALISIELSSGVETLLACATETTQDDVSFTDGESVPYVMFRSNNYRSDFYNLLSSNVRHRMSIVTFCKVKGLLSNTVIATHLSYGGILAQALPVLMGKQTRTLSEPAVRSPIYIAFVGGRLRMQRTLAPLFRVLEGKFGTTDGTVTKSSSGTRFVRIDKSYLVEVG